MKRRITLKYNRQWNEYIVMVFDENGKYIEMESYFTDDKQDAKDTLECMKKEYTEKGYSVI